MKGSPPRVRGKAAYYPATQRGARITPACAGKRKAFRLSITENADHPRVCGEKMSHTPESRIKVGSPPRVRGKANAALSAMTAARITPACAGKSIPCMRGAAVPQDHPRVCGEKSWFPCYRTGRQGSPPRVRGKVCRCSHFICVPRITPACAGKSNLWQSFRNLTPDHPRVCGEKHPIRPTTYLSKGSPPRVRGKVRLFLLGNGRVGITPACAGKSRLPPA